ncbi:ORF1259 [White spot syndrome virus]|uniref:ORF1259 n=1 Tax=White spot syndrome virus TaxID=342409 RepID=A0A2D3I6L7_9VIRU|nr:ORF1259 [White spot syndrome virus]
MVHRFFFRFFFLFFFFHLFCCQCLMRFSADKFCHTPNGQIGYSVSFLPQPFVISSVLIHTTQCLRIK